jgi:16S rRNA (cytosine967-C5)-methyltransferase
VSNSAVLRARAARIVAQVAAGRSLDALLQDVSGDHAADRGLLRALCYDSTRWYLRLEALLRQLQNRPQQQLPPLFQALAIVGLCQLIYTNIPAHAAVDQTVAATQSLGLGRMSGFLNAILRRWLREGEQLAALVDRDEAVRTAHPHWLLQSLARDWPDQLQQILAANNQHPAFWLRVNTRRCSGAAYRMQLEARGMRVLASLHQDTALLLERAVDVHELPGFAEGLVSVQDAAAQLAAHLMAPEPGDRVLDACAAPGGKTCHLAELQPQLVELVAIDVSQARMRKVADNLQRLDLEAQLRCADAGELDQWWDGRPFDRILLDVPCSATGVIRRHPDIKLLRRPTDIAALVERQSHLLHKLWSCLRPGGLLVYASCSALRAETSGVITAFLERSAPAKDITATLLGNLHLQEQVCQWGGGCAIAAGTLSMDGFYYACLEKTKG